MITTKEWKYFQLRMCDALNLLRIGLFDMNEYQRVLNELLAEYKATT